MYGFQMKPRLTCSAETAEWNPPSANSGLLNHCAAAPVRSASAPQLRRMKARLVLTCVLLSATTAHAAEITVVTSGAFAGIGVLMQGVQFCIGYRSATGVGNASG